MDLSRDYTIPDCVRFFGIKFQGGYDGDPETVVEYSLFNNVYDKFRVIEVPIESASLAQLD